MKKILCFLLSFLGLWAQPHYSVLVGSPVRQKPAILREFLASLKELNQASFTTDYFFIDDNDEEESSRLLRQFAEEKPCQILFAPSENKKDFLCNEKDHRWTEELMWRLAALKDQIIQYARIHGYDYLFLVDSDLVLHPQTLEQLIEDRKEIISNIFWTSWITGSLLPQVWMVDQYTQYRKDGAEVLSEKEIQKRQFEFLAKMREPGVYEVGGLGACTLISKKALNREISFRRIKNVTFWGEDRHFCLRAAALGINLYVDTHFPAYHIYRDSALSGVASFKRCCRREKRESPRVTLSMAVKNEADRYLRRILENASHYITDAVIIDDGSTDETVAICEEILKEIPHVIVHNETSKFSNEIDLRMQQWEATVKTDPDWIVFLDADQMIEPKFCDHLQQLITHPSFDAYYFRLYDFWDEEHYRDDRYWQAHNTHRPFMIRYRPDVPYLWEKKTAQHCGSFPSTVMFFIGGVLPFRVKHYGWATPELRMEKYQRYQILDPEGKYGIKEQYESILDESPNLVKWEE